MNNNLIEGSGGGGKSGGGSARVAVESPDSLRSIQYARVLDLISEGEIVGLVDGLKSIYLNDTPLQNADGTLNFTGVTWEQRTGTQSQSPITGFGASEAESAVGTEITAVNSVTRTVSNSNNSAIRVTLSVPTLTSQNTTNGDISGTDVTIAIDIQNNGGGFVAAALRKIYTTGNFNLTSTGAVTAVASTNFVIDVKWVPQSAQAPQTCGIQLQYRVVGTTSWLTYTSYTFSGGSLGTAASRSGGFLSYANGVNSYAAKTYTKSFTLTLASALYEFQLVKTSGSVQNASSGIFGSSNVSVGVAYGGSVSIPSGQIYQPVNTDTISGKTTSKYQRAYRIDLPQPGPWDIRVRRITADSTSSALQNKTYWDSFTEIIEANLNYPNSALQGLSIDAKQFSSIPSRGYEAKGRLVKMPNNYNPLTRVYTGAWNGTFTVGWTDNPAWAFYDMVINSRFGLGSFIDAALVDKWALYGIAQYCDEMVPDGFGGIEPRFVTSLYLQTQTQAFEVISNMASIFRGMAFWCNGNITASQDAPKDASALFNQANVVGGMFSYSGSSSRVRHTVCLVSWNDPDDAYRQKVEYVEDAAGITRYGIVQSNIAAIGCTSRGQAHRMGRWLLYSEQQETETISFRAAMDAVFVAPGDVIKTHDTNRAGSRFGGRLVSATMSQLTLDAPVTLASGQTYTINCVMPDGTVQARDISNAAGTYSVVNVSVTFSQLPAVHAIWLVNGSSVNLEQWRVISIAEADKTQVEITALAYSPLKFGVVEQNLALHPLPTSLINVSQPDAPSNISVVESTFINSSGIGSSKALISWNTSTTSLKFALSYKLGNDTVIGVNNNIEVNSFEMLNLLAGTYTFMVTAFNSLGKTSQVSTLTYTILGTSQAPKTVTGLSYTLSSFGIALVWSDITGSGVKDYEVREGSTWATATSLGFFGSNSALLNPRTVGTVKWLVKARNFLGNYAITEASLTGVISAPTAPTVTSSVVNQEYLLTYTTPVSGFLIDHYEIRVGSSWATSVFVATSGGLTYQAPVTFAGTSNFMVAAVDTAGNVGAEGSATIVILAPTAPIVTSQVVDNNVLFYWTDSHRTLPIGTYELRKGASFATATVIGTKSGLFTTVFETQAGTYTYWIVGIDTAGNYGVPTATAATMSQPPDYVLKANYNSTLNGTLSNALIDILGVNLPVDLKASVEQHFTQNLLAAPDRFNASSWIKSNCTITSDSVISPDGTSNADTVVRTAAGNHFLFQSYTTTSHANKQFTFSVWLKSGTMTGNVTVWVKDGAGATLKITQAALTSTWTRFSATGTFGAAPAGNIVVFIDPINDTGVIGDTFAVYGAQLVEAGSPAPYWFSPQEQVTAGYPLFIQPGLTSGYYEEVLDYGTVLASSKITVSASIQVASGSPVTVYKISTSSDGVTYTDYNGVTEVFATNFRYTKVRISVTSTAGADLAVITNLNIRLDVKLKNDAGSVASLSTDNSGAISGAGVGGTTIIFNVPFINVTSITVTPQGTTPITAIYDFIGTTANPLGCKVYLFNSAGARVSGTVSWSTKGY